MTALPEDNLPTTRTTRQVSLPVIPDNFHQESTLVIPDGFYQESSPVIPDSFYRESSSLPVLPSATLPPVDAR